MTEQRCRLFRIQKDSLLATHVLQYCIYLPSGDRCVTYLCQKWFAIEAQPCGPRRTAPHLVLTADAKGWEIFTLSDPPDLDMHVLSGTCSGNVRRKYIERVGNVLCCAVCDGGLGEDLPLLSTWL
jgi:hypothetical protein